MRKFDSVVFDSVEVYKATVTTSNPNTIMNYIGMTSTTFKERLANHNYTFEHKEHSNKTELSKYIWTLKDNKKDFNINWQILKRAISYTGGSKRCNLCLEEKFCILKENQNCLLNKRMEIISTCRHRKKFRVNNANNTLTYLTYLKIYLTTLAIHNIFVKIQWVDFQMGRVIQWGVLYCYTNYLNSHLNPTIRLGISA
jgi:hypothetical protein